MAEFNPKNSMKLDMIVGQKMRLHLKNLTFFQGLPKETIKETLLCPDMFISLINLEVAVETAKSSFRS